MKYLLLGKEGQLGKELSHRLLPLGEVVTLGRGALDLADLNKLNQLLEQIQPHIIINAAAYTNVDKAELDQAMAFMINEMAVLTMANYAKKYNATLIHYSTDYVFDGRKKGAYLENDLTNPLNIYGVSKLAGEKAILKSGCDYLIFRTSWVFSAHGHNFIKTILNLAKKKESLTVVHDEYGSPTSVELIAEMTLLAFKAYEQKKLTSGIYHLSASGMTNWHELACYSIEKVISHNIKLNIIKSKIQAVLSESYPRNAKRPKNSVLDTSLLSSTLNITMPHWSVDLDRMIAQLIQLGFFS